MTSGWGLLYKIDRQTLIFAHDTAIACWRSGRSEMHIYYSLIHYTICHEPHSYYIACDSDSRCAQVMNLMTNGDEYRHYSISKKSRIKRNIDYTLTHKTLNLNDVASSHTQIHILYAFLRVFGGL